jgi:hypothetical protein
MPQLDEKQLQALLRLKRYENPPPGYFDALLDRVHRRQREEMLRRPAWQIALERGRAFFAPMQMGWRHAGAMAAVLIVGIFAIRVAIPDRTAAPVQIDQIPAGSNLHAAAPSITLQPADAQPLTAQQNRRVTRDPDAPVRFIIDTQPVSYETTQIRF